MRELTPKLIEPLLSHVGSAPAWRVQPFYVDDFARLVEYVAQLSYANADHLFFFRGQGYDFQSKADGSTLYPSIYRGDRLAARELRHRFEMLDQASAMLVERWKTSGFEGFRDVRHKQYIQWSILQHYEVVRTPLLDFTHSLRVACSFAQMGSEAETCFVYVIGLPHITNRISVNSEHEIVNVRLLSICPPSALRPYYQEGYLAGTMDIRDDYEVKTELDFRNRLIAKFEIPSSREFWRRGFSRIPPASLYPKRDQVLDLCRKLKNDLVDDLQSGDIGQFIREWAEIEEWLLEAARHKTSRVLTVREAIKWLEKRQIISRAAAAELQALRVSRNEVVHRPSLVSDKSVSNWLSRMRKSRSQLDI